MDAHDFFQKSSEKFERLSSFWNSFTKSFHESNTLIPILFQVFHAHNKMEYWIISKSNVTTRDIYSYVMHPPQLYISLPISPLK